jgi:hypothetical protein
VISGGNKALREASQEIMEEVKESQPLSWPEQQLAIASLVLDEEIDLDSVQPGWNLDKNNRPLKGKILANRRAKVLRELQH